MKLSRYTLFIAAVTVFIAAVTVATPALAQTASTAPGPSPATGGVHDHGDATQPASADSKKVFEKLKGLAGSWTGQLTTTPSAPEADGKFVQFSMQVTSRGNALMHEMSVSGLPDHPLTMFYLEGDAMALTHYCDAGNRPHMRGTLSPDGNALEFEFVSLDGSNRTGHMHHAVITFIDDNHHVEEWTYMMPGDKPVRAHFDLHRTNFQAAPAR
jgi:hypothetical protein